jgi:hypothetical protein
VRKCGELFPGDKVPWRLMKKGEFPAVVQRVDGSLVHIPNEIAGEWDPAMGAYWDPFRGIWLKVTSVEEVQVPEGESFRWLVHGAA